MAAFAACAGLVSAQEDDSETIRIQDRSKDNPLPGWLVERLLGTLDLQIKLTEYENPGPHRLDIRWELHTNRNVNSFADASLFTVEVRKDDPVLTMATVIRKDDDFFEVTFISPDNSSSGGKQRDHLPPDGSSTTQHIYNEIPLQEETPILFHGITDSGRIESHHGQSKAEIVSAFDWVVIVSVTITPIDIQDAGND